MQQMNDDEIETLISELRSRRERAEVLLRANRLAASNASNASLKDRLTKQCDLAQKNLDQIKKHLDKLEERVNMMAALRLQAGDINISELADNVVEEKEVSDEV